MRATDRAAAAPADDPPSQVAAGRGGGLFRSSVTTSIAAAATVLTGLLLDLAIALRFGAGAGTDAFFVAARLPLGVAFILLAGANLALVPIFSTWLVTRSAREVWTSFSALLALIAAGATAVALVVGVASPLLVTLLAPGLSDGTHDLATTLLRVLVVVVPLTAVAEVLRAAANAQGSFAAPAAMNAVLNLTATGVVVLGSSHGIGVAAWGYVAGCSLRLLAMAGLCWSLGVRLHWTRGPGTGWHDPEARRALRLTWPSAASAGLSPTVRIAEGMVASFLPVGSITLLNYGYRLVFALGGAVFFRSVMSVLMPRLTRATASKDWAAVGRQTVRGVRAMLILATALTVVVGTLAVPACTVLFDRGSFDRDDAVRLGVLVAVLSLCLVGEGLQRALLAPFFAALDTRTPWRNALLAAATNLVLLPVLVLPFAGTDRALFGIAAAFVLSEYVGPAHAWFYLRRRPWSSLGVSSLLWTLGGSSVAAVAVAFALRDLLHLDTVRDPVAALALLALTGTVVLLVLAVGLALGRQPEMQIVKRAVRSRA